MDTPSIFEQPAATTASQPAPKSKVASAKKAMVASSPSGLHPMQERAIRFIAFMQDDVPQDQTVAQYVTQFTSQFLTEAVAYHITRTQRQGSELPPKLLTKLTEQQLVK